MSQEKEIQRWKVRWESLSEVMGSLRADITLTDIQEKDALQSLINGLALKGEEHFNVFLDGFSDNPQNGQFIIDRPQDSRVRFSKEYVLRKALDRIAFDLDVIYLAFKQRSDKSHYNSLEETLDLADNLALQALQPAIKQNLVGPGTVALTYLQKSYETRVIPYAEVSLIGIPFTSVRLTEDLLAIPHEVGHYVFWNSHLKGQNGQELLDPLRNASFEWTEEIFADVYGCVVAGPVMALDFQDLQLEFASYDPITKTNEFEEGVDQVHPTPILRPRIYSETLKKMKARGVTSTELGNLDNIADLLDSRWETKLGERGYLPQSAIPIPALQDKISSVIDDALNILEPEKAVTGFWSNQSVQNVEDLYDHFYLYAGEPHGPRPAVEIPVQAEEVVVQDDRIKIPVVEWLEELRADGWTTEGPHGRS
jgi:hypothetical protein